MTPRHRKLAWLALAVLVLATVFMLGRMFPPPAPGIAETEETAPHPEGMDPPWEFEWRDGDVRGIDIPRNVRVGNKRVPIRHLGDMHSEPDEEKLAFLQRVRTRLVAFSQTSRREACAEICSSPAGYAVRITTNDASTRCAVVSACPVGFVTVLESIHSHCPQGRSTASLSDELLSDGEYRRGKKIANCDTDRFSAMDYRARRPAWLAGPRALHRHEGPEKVASFGEPLGREELASAP